METTRRSLVKSLSWCVWATMITMVVAFVITGETTFAIEIGLLDTVIKFVSYFGHERIWVRIPYGKVPKENADYKI